MQQALSHANYEPVRRCPGPCSTSYAAPRYLLRQAARPSKTIAMASSPSSIFDLMDRQFADVERQFQMQLDRDFDAAFSRARALEHQANAEFQRALGRSVEEMRPAPSVEIQRQEERGPGMYRYYERIQITGGGGEGRSTYISQPPPAAATTLVGPVAPSLNPAFVGALVVVGCYATLTAAFNRNYPLTNYAESKRWLLLALWPLLWLFSPKFREQFGAAIRGERAGLRREGQAGSSSGGN